jgi:Helix-turn-helix domain
VLNISKPSIGPPRGENSKVKPLAQGIKDWKINGVYKSVIRNRNLSLGARVVYAELRSYLSKKCKEPYPSYETLARNLGFSPKSAYRFVKELEHAGVVSHTKRQFSSGRRGTNLWDQFV